MFWLETLPEVIYWVSDPPISMRSLIGSVRFSGFYTYTIVDIAKHTERDEKYAVCLPEEDFSFAPDFILRDLDKVMGDSPASMGESAHTGQSMLMDRRFEHWKSKPHDKKLYLVSGVGMDKVAERYVLYAPLYERGKVRMDADDVSCLARPFDNFFELVNRDGYRGSRFRRVR